MISTLKNTRVISFGVSRFRTYYTKDMVDSSDKKHDLEIKKNTKLVCKYLDNPPSYLNFVVFEKKVQEDLDIINHKLNKCMENQFIYMVTSNIASFWIAMMFHVYK
jgi:hypothetical protein